jgi:hypothetical protein
MLYQSSGWGKSRQAAQYCLNSYGSQKRVGAFCCVRREANGLQSGFPVSCEPVLGFFDKAGRELFVRKKVEMFLKATMCECFKESTFEERRRLTGEQYKADLLSESSEFWNRVVESLSDVVAIEQTFRLLLAKSFSVVLFLDEAS